MSREPLIHLEELGKSPLTRATMHFLLKSYSPLIFAPLVRLFRESEGKVFISAHSLSSTNSSKSESDFSRPEVRERGAMVGRVRVRMNEWMMMIDVCHFA